MTTAMTQKKYPASIPNLRPLLPYLGIGASSAPPHSKMLALSQVTYLDRELTEEDTQLVNWTKTASEAENLEQDPYAK